MEKVTHLILISDQSRKGTKVAETIKEVADELVMYDHIGAIINRVTNPELNQYIQIPGVEILAFIAADETHAANDIHGKSVFELPEDSNIMVGVHQALHNLGIF